MFKSAYIVLLNMECSCWVIKCSWIKIYLDNNKLWTSESSFLGRSHCIYIMKTEPLNCWHVAGMCVSAVCLFLTTKGLVVIRSVCRMDSQNRQWGVLFVLMLLNIETITTGKLPKSRLIACDSFVLNDPCVLLFRPESRAKHGQDASADIYGHGSGIQGDLLWHHATGAADRSWWRWGFCHWRYKHFTSY